MLTDTVAALPDPWPCQAVIVLKSSTVLDVMKDSVAVGYVSDIGYYAFELLAKFIPPVETEVEVRYLSMRNTLRNC